MQIPARGILYILLCPAVIRFAREIYTPAICFPNIPQSWIRLFSARHSKGKLRCVPLVSSCEPTIQIALSPVSTNLQPVTVFPRLYRLIKTAFPPTASKKQLVIWQFHVPSRNTVPPRWIDQSESEGMEYDSRNVEVVWAKRNPSKVMWLIGCSWLPVNRMTCCNTGTSTSAWFKSISSAG